MALGKGLEALLGSPGENTTQPQNTQEAIVRIPIDRIKPNRFQPRVEFNQEKLEELARSIKIHGLTQPLVVTATSMPGEFELIAGERRLRACKIAGLSEVSSIIRSVDDKEKFQLSLIENLQRQDLNPIEEARAFQKLSTDFGMTQEIISDLLGKDRSVIANSMRLLNLSEEIQEAIAIGVISPGHGRILAGIDDRSKQKALSERILREKLTVREIEKIVADWKSVFKDKKKSKKQNAELSALCEELQRKLGTKVKVAGSAKKGKIEIFYYSLKELERLSALLKAKKK